MYYLVSFGRNEERASSYIYSYDERELRPGMSVVVPAKNKEKIALVKRLYEKIPDYIDKEIHQGIKEIVRRNSEAIDADTIGNFIKDIIDDYKAATLSCTDTAEILDNMMLYNNIIPDGSKYEFILSTIPKVKKLAETGDELQFWKILRDAYYIIWRGKTYAETRHPSEKYDPIEDTDQYIMIENELNRLIFVELSERSECGRISGVSYLYAKKRILKDRYNIDWMSPLELNPGMRID